MLFMHTPSERPIGYKIFSLRGIPFYVEPMFLVFVGFLMLIDLSSTGNLIHTAMFGAILFFSLIAHEAGHALMAQHYRLTPIRVSLVTLGGYALHGHPRTPGQGLAVCLAGPAMTFLLVLAGYLMLKVGPEGERYQNFAFMLAGLNLIWLIFNMLPIFQLDGGRSIYYALLFKFSHRKAMYYSLVTSLVTVAAVFLLMLKFGRILPFVMLILGLLGWQCWQMLQQFRAQY